jgi:7,8-dihydro-6-hydroxymethylpterin dimethyltransferase
LSLPAGFLVRPDGDPALEERVLEATRALCNVCGRLVEAQVVASGQRVLLRKRCPEHGVTRALVSSDIGWYLGSRAFVKPGTDPRRRSVPTFSGCPDSCGLCPEHLQHTCVPLLEITSDCDMSCPVCLVEGRTAGPLSVVEVQAIVNRLLECEGRLNMLTLSGGEPTRHPELEAILDVVCRPELGIVSLSTNGIRLASDDRLLDELVRRGVVVALQLDGFSARTTSKLRGDPSLGELKRRVIDRVLGAGGKLSLVVTLARGVNEEELPEIVRLFLAEDRILSMMVQPLAWAGRASEQLAVDPLDVVTVPEVVARLAASSGGLLAPDDFTPLPCSHPSCFALTYLLRLGDGRLVPLPRVLDAAGYLEIIANQALLGTDRESLERIRGSLYALWSASGQIPDRDAVLAVVRRLLLDLVALGPRAAHTEVLALGLASVKSVFVHHFMDRLTFDLARVVKCCNHYLARDGRLLPACVRNNIPAG